MKFRYFIMSIERDRGVELYDLYYSRNIIRVIKEEDCDGRGM
jgi:hypothetical protein